MAMAELGCHHATIPEDIIQQLSILNIQSNPPPGQGQLSKPGTVSGRLSHLAAVDPLAGPNWNGELASTKVDYLSQGGAALSKAISEDDVTARGLHEALEAFKANELQSKVAIEEVLRQLENASDQC